MVETKLSRFEKISTCDHESKSQLLAKMAFHTKNLTLKTPHCTEKVFEFDLIIPWLLLQNESARLRTIAPTRPTHH